MLKIGPRQQHLLLMLECIKSCSKVVRLLLSAGTLNTTPKGTMMTTRPSTATRAMTSQWVTTSLRCARQNVAPASAVRLGASAVMARAPTLTAASQVQSAAAPRSQSAASLGLSAVAQPTLTASQTQAAAQSAVTRAPCAAVSQAQSSVASRALCAAAMVARATPKCAVIRGLCAATAAFPAAKLRAALLAHCAAPTQPTHLQGQSAVGVVVYALLALLEVELHPKMETRQ
jgi:hypothetical protein